MNMRRSYDDTTEKKPVTYITSHNCTKISPFVLEYHYTQHVNIQEGTKKIMLRVSS